MKHEDAGDTGDVALVEVVRQARADILKEFARRVVGQETVVDMCLVTLFCGGHAVLVGVPGLAKTTIISTLAACLDLRFNRIQFTPDLMPSDITGSEVLEEDRVSGKRSFRFVRGPVFANVVLADEINRAPPKTQSALLEAMQEHKVTIAGVDHCLEEPFHVFATQNPIEQEGTYPLPEAQLDRFLMSISMDYPTLEEERRVALLSSSMALSGRVNKVLGQATLMRIQALVPRVPVSKKTVDYAVALVRATRPQDPSAPKRVKDYVAYGAGPRAGQHLLLCAKAWALLSGRYMVSIEDIRKLAVPILSHRLVLGFRGHTDQVSTAELVGHALESVS